MILLALALSTALAVAPATPALTGAAQPRGRVVDRVAATVNGEVVTLLDLAERAGPELQRADAQAAGPAREKARTRALKTAFDALVAERLFEGQAAALGIEVTDAEVDQSIDEIKRRNNLDDARLDEALAAQGMDRVAYRKAVRHDLQTAHIMGVKVGSRVKVTDDDVKNYWQTHPREFAASDEVRVRHILVALPEGASAAQTSAAHARAEKIAARLRAGEDFAKVAREVSDGPSAREGGELGWLQRGTVQPDIEKAAFALAAGQVSAPVQARAGFQILQVEERRGGSLKPLDSVKEDIRNRLVQEQVDSYREGFIAELRKDAVIDVRIPELRD